MQDPLDKFMRENRAAFDNAEPDAKVWGNIEKAMTPAGPARIVKIWAYARVAAIAIFLISIGAATGSYFTKNHEGAGSLAMQDLATEYAEAESYYVSEINYKLNRVKSFQEAEPVLKDIEELDEEFKLLRSKLGDEATDEMIISAMIKNYKTKVRLLERVLERMEKSETEKTEQNENIQL